MKIKPNLVIADLERYLKLYNISLSKDSKKTLTDIENFAYECDNPVNYELFFSKVIENSKHVQEILLNKGANPRLISLVLEKHYYKLIDEMSSYSEIDYSYSKIDGREISGKTAIIDRALEYSVKRNRNTLENEDIILAAMDEYENNLIQDDNLYWRDKRLENCDTTLSHICGDYDERLWIRFDDIREALIFNKTCEMVEVA
ncbi:hypothetical protein [Dethiothermospora halolimnae]|uniref:hypothetical protein n=1 Tax=Dethiothermospora halolimnae TaxID=3114390 RepID=UPI003CCBDBCD